MRWQPRLSSSIPETRTSRPLTLASCTLSSERRASSRRKLSRRAMAQPCAVMCSASFHARVQPLLAADVGFGLGGEHTAFAERELLVRHQAPGSGTFRCQLADARALFRIEVDTHVFLIAGHGGQRLLARVSSCVGCRVSSQRITARHLLHQLQQFLATRLFVLGTKALE